MSESASDPGGEDVGEAVGREAVREAAGDTAAGEARGLTTKYGTLRTEPHLDAALAALAATQHLVFDLAQLKELGLSASSVRSRVLRGRLHRIHRRVYSLVPSELLSRDGVFMAAILACGPGAVLSHRSAAALHELRRTERARIDVTVPGEWRRGPAGIDVHRSRTLTVLDITRVNGIPCTTLARTQLDIVEVINRRGVERVLDQAEILEVFDLRGLNDQIERNVARPAARLLRAVLDDHYVGRTPTATELEEALLAHTRKLRLPDPEVNKLVDPGDGERAIQADFVWSDRRLIIETDGGRTHRTRQAFERDRRNDQRLIAAGWRVVRITWRQLTNEPERIAALLRRLLGPL